MSARSIAEESMAAERNNAAKDRGAARIAGVVHICQPEHSNSGGMRNFYDKLKVYATSINGDEILIRSHIAYWSGSKIAEAAVIRPSRGNSYRVICGLATKIVRIEDHYDHREGVTGWK